MKNIKLIFLGVLGVIILGIILCYVNYNNREVGLRTESDAQRAKIEGIHDKMWKTLRQKAQVSNEYVQSFDSIYSHIMEGRYSKEGDATLMKWIKESNPQFDASLYKDLMMSIETLRTEFQLSQERMLDIIREHKTLCSTVPGVWFVSDKTPIDYTVVSSSRSKAAMQEGTYDDTDLFK